MRIQLQDPRLLVQELTKSAGRGYGLIPLVGSGLSVESGIPPGGALEKYLSSVLDGCMKDSIDLRKGWPALTECGERYKPPKEPRTRLEDEAARALGRWSDVLVFLSRLRPGRTLGKPDPRIIDAFGHLLTRGARPNFGHVMLALLARSMRIRTVVTTNFDDLLEHAFQQARIPLDIYDIPMQGKLPDYRLATTHPSIIKLHGSRVGIRADASLDHSPEREDVFTFAGYLCGDDCGGDGDVLECSSAGGVEESRPRGRLLTLRRNLLVVGFSGSDLRIMELIVRALRVLSRMKGDEEKNEPWAKVYWVCHQQTDVKALENSLELVGAKKAEVESFVVTYEDAQLLLHELYIAATKTMPSRGLDYDFIRDIAPVPRGVIDSKLAANWRARLLAEPRSTAPLVVTGERALSSFFAGLHWSLSGQPRPFSENLGSRSSKRCVWLEPSAFASPQALIRGLLSRLTLRTGRYETGLLRLEPSAGAAAPSGMDEGDRLTAHVAVLCRRFNVTPTEWAIFLYGRDGGGALDTRWADEPRPPNPEPPGDWRIHFDVRGGKPRLWADPEWNELARYLTALSAIGFTLVYLPFNSSRHEFFRERLPGFELGAPDTARALSTDHEIILGSGEHNARAILTSAVDWALSDAWPRDWASTPYLDAATGKDRRRRRKLRFLHTLSLCRQVQNRFVLLSNAAFSCSNRFNQEGHDNDVLREEFVTFAIDALVEIGLLRRSPGGFVWMHRDVRLTLTAIIEADRQLFVALARTDGDRARAYLELVDKIESTSFDGAKYRARRHRDIADIYEVGFRSVNDHQLIFEELYHLHQAIIHGATFNSWEEPAEQRVFVEGCLIRARCVLHSAFPALQRGLDHELAAKLFSHDTPIALRCLVAPTMRESRTREYFERYEAEWKRVHAEFFLRDEEDSGQGPSSLLPDPPVPTSADDRTENDHLRGARFSKLEYLNTRRLRTRADRAKRNYETVETELAEVLAAALRNGCAEGALMCANGLEQELRSLGAHEGDQAAFVESRRTIRRCMWSWFDALGGDPELRNRQVVLVVRTLQEMAWLWADELEDRFLFCWTAGPGRGDDTALQRAAERNRSKRKFALRLCVLCNVTLELAKLIDFASSESEEHEIILIRSYYAHALAFLARFTEAHRHLNEAFGLLARSRFNAQSHYWSVLELRRAALYLLQAQFEYLDRRSGVPILGRRERAPSERFILASLDDAWLALTRARTGLVAATRAVRHWGRLFVYELRTLALYADLEVNEDYRVEGLPDKLPGGRLRRAFELLMSEAVLDAGTRVRGAQIAHSAALVLVAQHRQSGRDEVSREIATLLTEWRRMGDLDTSVRDLQVDEELREQLQEFVSGVEAWVDEVVQAPPRSGFFQRTDNGAPPTPGGSEKTVG